MWRGLLGKKLGMTHVFNDRGDRVGVTIVQAGPCPILQMKRTVGEKETDKAEGYDAYQLGFDVKSDKAANKPEKGHAAKSNSEPRRFIREIRLREPRKDMKAGDVLTVESWEDVKVVQVTGKSKGKGFQGVMKRHGYHGLRATHGVKTHHRHPGSSGSLTPARTVKGRKAPGHMGSEWVTTKGLKVVQIIAESNLMLIEGSVPGPANGYIIIRPAQPYMP